MYWGYIKKEDAKDLAKTQRINSYIVLGANVITLGMFNFLIIPRLYELTADLNYVLPFYSRYYLHFSFLILAIMFLLISDSSYLEEDLKKELGKYKKGEMILLRKLWNKKYQWRVMTGLFLVMSYLVISIILPVYQITSSIQ